MNKQIDMCVLNVCVCATDLISGWLAQYARVWRHGILCAYARHNRHTLYLHPSILYIFSCVIVVVVSSIECGPRRRYQTMARVFVSSLLLYLCLRGDLFHYCILECCSTANYYHCYLICRMLPAAILRI